MDADYDKLKELVIKSFKQAFMSSFKKHSKGLNELGDYLIERAEEVGVDSSRLKKALKKFKIFQRRKQSNKMKKLILTILLASFITVIIGLLIKNYEKIKKGKNAEEKIRIFIDSLELEKLKNNKTVKLLRKELKKLL